MIAWSVSPFGVTDVCRNPDLRTEFRRRRQAGRVDGHRTGLEWRNWQTHWTQNPAPLTGREGSTPSSSTILLVAASGSHHLGTPGVFKSALGRASAACNGDGSASGTNRDPTQFCSSCHGGCSDRRSQPRRWGIPEVQTESPRAYPIVAPQFLSWVPAARCATPVPANSACPDKLRVCWQPFGSPGHQLQSCQRGLDFPPYDQRLDAGCVRANIRLRVTEPSVREVLANLHGMRNPGRRTAVDDQAHRWHPGDPCG